MVCLGLQKFPRHETVSFKIKTAPGKPFQFLWNCWGSMDVEFFILMPRKSWENKDEFVSLMGVEVVRE